MSLGSKLLRAANPALYRSTSKVAQKIAQIPDYDVARLRQCEIVAVDDPTRTVTIFESGDTGTQIAGVRVLGECVPQVGDIVWLLKNGTDRWVLGLYATKRIFTPTLTGGPGGGTWLGMEMTVGGMNYVQIAYTYGTSQGTTTWEMSGFRVRAQSGSLTQNLPLGQWWYVKPSSTQRASGVVLASNTDKVVCQVGGSSPTLAGFSAVGSGSPEVWASGAQLMMTFSYPVEEAF